MTALLVWRTVKRSHEMSSSETNCGATFKGWQRAAEAYDRAGSVYKCRWWKVTGLYSLSAEVLRVLAVKRPGFAA
jgi:hypothetical protein